LAGVSAALLLALVRRSGRIPTAAVGPLLRAVRLLRAVGPLRAVGAVTAVVTVLLLVAVVRPSGPGAGSWGVAACDVGQGDALVVRSGPHSAVMVDVGPPGQAAARCLRALGVRHLDLLVLTHAHQDHVGGLAPVLDAVTVDAALLGPTPGGAPPDDAVRQA